MDYQKYESQVSGHFRNARSLLLSKKHITANILAQMTDKDVEKEINARYIAIQLGDDWILVPKEKKNEFEKMITWICR
ncbi:hypothetical protein [Thomasclavelia spiroformis]|uniref:hypothetical protein n=1 Tax=Thomasclavelia spiroformis TaxID=29348 RepID=UPI00320A0746